MNWFSKQNMRYVWSILPSRRQAPLAWDRLWPPWARRLTPEAHGGALRLRIATRTRPGVVQDSQDRIVQSLTAHGVRWEGAVHKTD
jgi:hypothetical protein